MDNIESMLSLSLDDNGSEAFEGIGIVIDNESEDAAMTGGNCQL